MENDIYDDIANVDLGNKIHQLEDENRQLLEHIHGLERDIEKLFTELKNMKQVQQNLCRNISELYKTAKLEIQRKDKIISELRLKIDNMIFRREDNRSSKRQFFNEEQSKVDDFIDHKQLKKNLNENEEVAVSVPEKNLFGSRRSTPEASRDNLQFKHNKTGTGYRSDNDRSHNSRYPLQKPPYGRNRSNQHIRRGRYNDRHRRSRSRDRMSKSRSREKYRNITYDKSRSRSIGQSSNKSEDMKIGQHNKTSEKYCLENPGSENKNIYSKRTALSDRFENSFDKSKLEEGEIASENDNLIMAEANIHNSDYFNDTKTTFTSKSDTKPISIEEYRKRLKVITTNVANTSNLKLKENSIKDVQVTDNNKNSSLNRKNPCHDIINTDVITLKQVNTNSVKDVNIDTITSSITNNISINTSTCSNSSENTSFNNSGTRIRRRRCIVLGFKDKV